LDSSLKDKSLMDLLAQAGELSAFISYLMVIDTPQQGLPCRIYNEMPQEKTKVKRDSLQRQALGRKRAKTIKPTEK